MVKVRPTGEGGMPKRLKIWLFQGQTLMKWTETFTEQSQPLGPSFPPGFTPRVLRRYALPCKTLSSGSKVARFCEGVKKPRQGDYWTSKQNANPIQSQVRHFINVCPLKKPNFQPLWHASLPSWSHFEHSGTKMGSPDNEALY